MKITLIHMLITSVSIMMGYAVDSSGQEVLERKLTLQAENADVKTVLAEIEKKADVKFTYRPRLIRDIENVNLDVTGTGTQIDVVGTRDLVDRAVDLADSLDINAVSSTVPAGTSSDHASFQRVGVDVVYFASDDYSKIHTPSDTLATIDAVLLDDTGDLAYAFILSQLRPVARG